VASIKTRGPKNARRYYVNYDVGRTTEGQRIQRMHLLKGVTNLVDARQELARVERDVVADRDPFAPVVKEQVGPLLDRWKESLTNRSAADDRSRIKNHLQPKFKAMTLEAVTLPVVMKWVDVLAKTDLSPQSQRHMLNLLSRFFSWCIERGLATVNPVKMVPQGRRPVAVKTEDAPWLDDPKKVEELVTVLGAEVGLMFYLANGSGMRLGEVCGLRINDLDFLHEGIIRVAHSYDGPLKEDRRSEGKVKWVPAPYDAEARVKVQLARRRLQGATGDELLFPYVPKKRQNRRRTSDWTGYRKEYVEALWDDAAEAVGIDMTWYEATRHSFVSRSLKAGASLDEVSAAVGHSSPLVTRRFYDHYVRRTYSDALRGRAN
jgi:integrase